MFVYSFQTLAEQLTDEELAEGRLYPPLANIREVSVQMAVKVKLLKIAWNFCKPVNVDPNFCCFCQNFIFQIHIRGSPQHDKLLKP